MQSIPHLVENAKSFLALHLLCKLISKVLDIKYMASRLALVLPFFAVGIKDAVSKEIVEGRVKFRTLDVIFKVLYMYVCIYLSSSVKVRLSNAQGGSCHVTFQNVFDVARINGGDMTRNTESGHGADTIFSVQNRQLACIGNKRLTESIRPTA